MDKENHPANSLAVNVNLDTTPILYTDNVFMSINEFGIVLDVVQKLGPTNQARIVARIGMSREHAKKFVQELGKLILMSEGQKESGKKEQLN